MTAAADRSGPSGSTRTLQTALVDLAQDTPVAETVDGVDLVLIRRGDEVVVLEGRCPHRGALLADGAVRGHDLVCGVHGWDFRLDTGISAYDPSQRIHRFAARVRDGAVELDAIELAHFARERALSGPVEVYDRLWSDPHQNSPEEPYVGEIHTLARHGLTRTGHHGPVAAMGVARTELPHWEDIQILTAQLATLPLLDDEPVSTTVVIGPRAAKPLSLDIPVFVSDMSFGALSQEAKTALARGAERAGTAICSGEGGILPEEHAECSRYLYEVASARFGWSPAILPAVQAIHIKLGQGAKTGTGGHLPGQKVVGRIAEVRGLPPGTPAVSPARFPEWTGPQQARELVELLRDGSGGVPIGVKMSAQHVEADLDVALDLGVDYVILDGRGGGTGAAPTILRDNISVPLMAGLARARRRMDGQGLGREVSLIATGGLRRPADVVKALALGADAVAVSNTALQAIGCVGMRACHTDNCPVGIATQKPHLRARLPVEGAADQLARYLHAAVELMTVLARACGHRSLSDFRAGDLTSWRREVADLVGISYAGVHGKSS
jgi:glutamate synthase domain-containing protein 2/nitrite reductase/ring-hydroxylating ferredoxin subunit